jgi:hypothetical protein
MTKILERSLAEDYRKQEDFFVFWVALPPSGYQTSLTLNKVISE